MPAEFYSRQRQRGQALRAGLRAAAAGYAHRPDGMRQDAVRRVHGGPVGSVTGHRQLPRRSHQLRSGRAIHRDGR